jgi:hypothetical protein
MELVQNDHEGLSIRSVVVNRFRVLSVRRSSDAFWPLTAVHRSILIRDNRVKLDNFLVLQAIVLSFDFVPQCINITGVIRLEMSLTLCFSLQGCGGLIMPCFSSFLYLFLSFDPLKNILVTFLVRFISQLLSTKPLFIHQFNMNILKVGHFFCNVTACNLLEHYVVLRSLNCLLHRCGLHKVHG